MTLLNKKTQKLARIFLVSLLFITFSVTTVYATPEDDLEAIKRRLEQIKKDKENVQDDINNENSLQSEYSTELMAVKNKVNLLEIEIEETQLTIKQLNLEIKLLKAEISGNEEEIEAAQTKIAMLQEETDARLIQMYLDQKTSSSFDMVFQAEATSLIKLELYQSTVQDETNELLANLEIKKLEFEEKLEKLETDKVQVQRDKVQVKEEKTSLERDKTALDAQKEIYARKLNESIARENDHENILGALTEQEQWAVAEQTRLQQIIFDSFNDIPTGSPVKKGTVIGFQGCSGLCTGPHLHFSLKVNGSYVNPCSALPSGHLSGCGTSSPSLSQWPIGESIALTSGYGWRWGSFHYGIDVQNYSNLSTAIYAAHDGYIYYGNDNACSWYTGSLPCNGAGANYAIICQNSNCSVGKKSIYLHLK